MLPPCELAVDRKSHFAQSYVIKAARGTSPDVLRTWASGELVHGAGGFAIVSLKVPEELYLVLTDAKAHRIDGRERAIKKGILQLPGSPRVEWIRPLGRRLQRLLGWGDVATTRGDVARATKAGNLEELRAIMPQAVRIINHGNLELLPAVYDALQNVALMPALQDAAPAQCKHDFFHWTTIADAAEKLEELKELALEKKQQPPTMALLREPIGPCCHGPPDKHRGPYTRCLTCRMICCFKCARTAGEQQEEREELQDALRECQEPPSDPSTVWKQHPCRPLPFYVIDLKNISEEEKVAWIRQELGDCAQLRDFAAKFLELFGVKIKGAMPQKSACLKLFIQYVPLDSPARSWKKECDIPPDDLEMFQRVWDPKAPRRCRECAKALTGPGDYCCRKCEYAGRAIVDCAVCGATLDSYHPYCTDCRIGSPCIPRGGQCDDQAQMLSMVQRMWSGRYDLHDDPAREQAWKKRRRS